MSYTPPTPTLPEGEELGKVLHAFKQLPTGPWAWTGYVGMSRKSTIFLAASQSGQPSLLQSSEKDGFLFRDTLGYMQDAKEIVRPTRNEIAVSRLNNPAAIALASAWMVPLLVEENKKLREALAERDKSDYFVEPQELPNGDVLYGPYSTSPLAIVKANWCCEVIDFEERHNAFAHAGKCGVPITLLPFANDNDTFIHMMIGGEPGIMTLHTDLGQRHVSLEEFYEMCDQYAAAQC